MLRIKVLRVIVYSIGTYPSLRLLVNFETEISAVRPAGCLFFTKNREKGITYVRGPNANSEGTIATLIRMSVPRLGCDCIKLKNKSDICTVDDNLSLSPIVRFS